MPRYRFTGRTPEDFPAPPIARRLEPGDEVETDEAVSHARLELLDGSEEEEAADAPAEEPAEAAAPARSRSRAAKTTQEA
jgi:hypothetical protein